MGISPDPVSAQANFRSELDLPYKLLADAEHSVAEKYGVWVEKNQDGKQSMGVERSTFVIDKEGKIAKLYRNVQSAGHAAEVLVALDGI